VPAEALLEAGRDTRIEAAIRAEEKVNVPHWRIV
jgi:hypothetical protein